MKHLVVLISLMIGISAHAQVEPNPLCKVLLSEQLWKGTDLELEKIGELLSKKGFTPIYTTEFTKDGVYFSLNRLERFHWWYDDVNLFGVELAYGWANYTFLSKNTKRRSKNLSKKRKLKIIHKFLDETVVSCDNVIEKAKEKYNTPF